jgi:hypothetical protein
MSTAEQLRQLWHDMRREENSQEYIDELIDQVALLGTESNALTREHVLRRLERVCQGIRKTLEN